ncbi:hypothetical protein D3C78_1230810 [compost metagenome]
MAVAQAGVAGLPGLAAILRHQQAAEAAGGEQRTAGGAPHAHQRLGGFGVEMRFLPVPSAVLAAQDPVVMTDRQAQRRLGEEHLGQGRAALGRHGGLAPWLAGALAVEQVTQLAGGDQLRTIGLCRAVDQHQFRSGAADREHRAGAGQERRDRARGHQTDDAQADPDAGTAGRLAGADLCRRHGAQGRLCIYFCDWLHDSSSSTQTRPSQSRLRYWGMARLWRREGVAASSDQTREVIPPSFGRCFRYGTGGGSRLVCRPSGRQSDACDGGETARRI